MSVVRTMNEMVDRVERLEAAIGSFAVACERYGQLLPARLSDSHAIGDVLAEVARAIAPRQLPTEIDWFWRTWDVASFDRILGHPSLCSPEFALEVWRDTDDFHWPRALFPVAYESHCFLAVELRSEGSAGRWIYDYCYGDGAHKLRAPEFATLFEVAAAAIEAGEFWPGEVPPMLSDVHLASRFQAECEQASIPASEFGPFDDHDIMSWPPRWRVQQGVHDSAAVLRGATCTIAELVEARMQGPVVATIVGEISSGLGNAQGQLAVVNDPTGKVDVWIPASVPSLGRSRRCEYDVVAAPLGLPEVTIDDFAQDLHDSTRLGLQGQIEQAAAASRAAREHSLEPHPVIAIAVRPMD